MQLLRRSQSALVLMDMSAELPDLKRTKGLNNWLVRGQNKFYSTWEEATDEAVRTYPLRPHPEYLPGQGRLLKSKIFQSHRRRLYINWTI